MPISSTHTSHAIQHPSLLRGVPVSVKRMVYPPSQLKVLSSSAVAGYGAFLTAWGKPSIAKTVLRPVITLTSYWLGHQALVENYLVGPQSRHRLLPSLISAECMAFPCAENSCSQGRKLTQHRELLTRVEHFCVISGHPY